MANVLSFQTVQWSPRFGTTTALPEVLDAVAAAGFTAVGLDHWTVDAYEAAGGSLDALAVLLDDRGLRCTDVVSLGLAGPDVRTATETARRLAEIGARLGAAVAAGGFAPPENGAAAVTTAQAVDLVGACADVLSDAGLRIGLEYLPYSPLSTVAQVADVCAAAGWDRAGLLVDTWATCVSGQTKALRTLPPGAIALVQVCDGHRAVTRPLVEESRHHRVAPGHGDLEVDDVVRTVLASGYDGPVSTEVLADAFRAMPVGDAARLAHDASAACWGRAGGTTT